MWRTIANSVVASPATRPDTLRKQQRTYRVHGVALLTLGLEDLRSLFDRHREVIGWWASGYGSQGYGYVAATFRRYSVASHGDDVIINGPASLIVVISCYGSPKYP
jgi:hypothetical protein